MEIKDSGERRQFESGAVRDIQNGKGRCDLLPLEQVARFIELYGDIDTTGGLSEIINEIDNFMLTRQDTCIYSAINKFICYNYDEKYISAILSLSKHYEDGARKYDERNWEKGIPLHCYIDSGLRHLLKFYSDWKDEPHDRAFLWNMFGLLWTMKNKPDMDDLPTARLNNAENKDSNKEPGI